MLYEVITHGVLVAEPARTIGSQRTDGEQLERGALGGIAQPTMGAIDHRHAATAQLAVQLV